MRLKSIKNIAKITKSMKMIASTKVTKAQKIMDQARLYGESAVGLLKHTGESSPGLKSLVVTCSSDRGLCGGIHSSVSKFTKRFVKDKDAKIAVLGLKARTQLQRDHRKHIALSFDGVTKFTATWLEAATIGHQILSAKIPSDSTSIVFNKFKSVIAYDATVTTLPSLDALQKARIFL